MSRDEIIGVGLIVEDEWLDLTDWKKLLEAFIEKHEEKNKNSEEKGWCSWNEREAEETQD